MIKVLNTGFYSTIQDFGRVGFQQYGVPYSGVMDRKSAALANVLLGNNKNDGVIEMTMTGARLQFKTATCIVLSGADMSAKLNDRFIRLNKIINVNPNDVLTFGKLKNGFRCYLAVLGGFNTETIMGSKSMYQNITKQVTLLKNDELLINESSKINLNQHASIRMDTSYMTSRIIDVFKGPEFDMLTDSQQNQLFSKPFTISKDNNRMAYQLEESINNNIESIITSPVLPGTVQLTPSGTLIVLMRDCQTTGGYPRVLQLQETGANILAQKFMGQSLYFKLTDV
ncbi:MAG: biotin-dependent carboxyltransferase family protein [Algibacter sp.]